MGKIKKILIPKWTFWMVLVMILLILLFVDYQYFTNPQTRAEMGTVGIVFMHLILLLVVVLIYLMSYGGLPAYIIKEEEEEKQ